MTDTERFAPGWPGITPRWTSSAKSGIGTAFEAESRVWFTISHGILNEVYYPRIDRACTRDMGLLVTDGANFVAEEKRHTTSKVKSLADGVPALHLENACKEGRFRIEKDIFTHCHRDALLQRVRFVALQQMLGNYQLFVLLAPHLANHGQGNTGWSGDYKGVPMLFAERDGTALALACSVPWLKRSVGFVGRSDGWNDIMRHKQMTWEYTRAENGNVALTAEIDLNANKGEFILVLAFGANASEAGHNALATLQDSYDELREEYLNQWKRWQNEIIPLDKVQPNKNHNFYRISTAVLRAHEAVHFPGGTIASLSIPWGFSKTDNDLGGYHLAWPRDMVEAAGAFLAAGAKQEVRRALEYLQITQEADGHWPQTMWLDGSAYWDGIQLDEAALPILLVDLVRRHHALTPEADLNRFWPMVRKAAGFIVRNGPVTQEDRWEEDPGYSPFTLAAEIAGLLAAADLADSCDEGDIATHLRETADFWNDCVERWIYVVGNEWAKKCGVEGYYVRIAPPETAEGSSPMQGYVPIKNRPAGQSSVPAAEVVSPDALALVRFGLRAPDDPRILNTIKVIDHLLRVETPSGPCWHRYNDDGYGEHEDGSAFDGSGIGRVWPLLTGERAHYELAAGNRGEACRLLATLEALSSDGGLIPEQIWDAPDIPKRELFFGRPSGSAMPLVWAHAEHVKLLRSLHDGHVFDCPPQTVQRYLVDKTQSKFALWRFNHKIRVMPPGKSLRIESLMPAHVHWSTDNWKTVQDTMTRDTGLGIHVCDLPVRTLPDNSQVVFTFYWPHVDRWEGVDYAVEVNGQKWKDQ